MADLATAAAEVLAGTSLKEQYEYGIMGETGTAGQVVYRVAGDSTLKLAQADGTLAEATVLGVLVCSAVTGQKGAVQKTGTFTIGATASVTGGAMIWLSETAGELTLTEADITAASYVVPIGVANASDQVVLEIATPSVVHA